LAIPSGYAIMIAMHPTPPPRSLRVWMNSFIPAHLPGFTSPLVVGEREGWTVLAPPEGERSIFTHQRAFNPATDADSLLHSHARLSWMGAAPMLEQWHRSHLAQEDTGDVAGEPPAGDVSRMAIKLVTHRTMASDADAAKLIHTTPRRPGQSPSGLIYLAIDCQSAEGSGLFYEWFGPASYRGVVIFDPTVRTVDFSGTISRFPAFEMYASINDGPAHAVVRTSPPRGSDLFTHGPGERPIRDGVKLP
jgi:hypothetical protein